MPPKQVKLLAGRISCVIGLILADISGTGASVPAGALGDGAVFRARGEPGPHPGIEQFDRALPAREG